MTMNADAAAPDQQALNVTGMTCDGCARTIERILSRVPGVDNARVDFELGLCVVRGTTSTADLVSAIRRAGYGATAVGRDEAKRAQS
jgi:copper chaperone CopZ